MMGNEPLAVVVATKALDALSMRMAAVSQNIANAGSTRFQPLSLDFEKALKAAAQEGPDAVKALSFSFEAGREMLPGEDRRLDLLIADGSQTAARYAALADMLGRRLSIQRALTGGQR